MTHRQFTSNVFSINRPFAAQKRGTGVGRARGGWRATEKSKHDERGGQCDRHENVKQDTECAVVCLRENGLPQRGQKSDGLWEIAGCHALGGLRGGLARSGRERCECVG